MSSQLPDNLYAVLCACMPKDAWCMRRLSSALSHRHAATHGSALMRSSVAP